MKVAVDARELGGHPTGVGRYLHELMAEWSRSAHARRHDWTLYAPSPPAVPAGFNAGLRILPGSGGTIWEQWRLPRALAADRPDVLFAPAYTAPLTSPCPVLLAIHDVSFAAHPEWFSIREGWRRRVATRWSARRARGILTISEFSKREIVSRLGPSPDRVRVTYLGHRSGAIEPRVDREPLVLYVGSIFARRRVDELVRAFLETVAPEVPAARLELVGEDRRPAHLRTDLGLGGVSSAHRARVHVRSYVDETTLTRLYARASVFAFLSEYEGFGLTPVEALAAGAAPVLLDTPVAREICGPAARYVRLAAGTRELGAVLLELLTNQSARDALLLAAPAVLARYDWARTAEATLIALEEAAGAR
jgi:glycosyltransferase involved in cell wall biosynthesis